MRRQIEGSRAIAETVARCRPEVICAYPISPQTHIVEALSEIVRSGALKPCEYINDCAGGLLCAASSTHKMSTGDFDLALAEGAARLGTDLRIVERLGLPINFPVAPGFPEGNYLKFAVALRD